MLASVSISWRRGKKFYSKNTWVFLTLEVSCWCQRSHFLWEPHCCKWITVIRETMLSKKNVTLYIPQEVYIYTNHAYQTGQAAPFLKTTQNATLHWMKQKLTTGVQVCDPRRARASSNLKNVRKKSFKSLTICAVNKTIWLYIKTTIFI